MTAHRMRAMQLVANLERGGAQEVVRTLAEHLPAAGVDPTVVSFADGPLRADIERLGIPVAIVPGRTRSLSSGVSAFAELRAIRGELGAAIRRYRPHVVQTHLLHSMDFLALDLRREPGVKAVFWTVHNARLELRADQLPGQQWLLAPKRFAHRWLYRAGGRLVDGFIAVSDDVGRAVRTLYRPPRERLEIIPNGVDTDRYPAAVDRGEVRRSLGLAADTPVAIVVAKLMRQKGHRVYLEALPAVLASNPELQTLFVGDGELRVELEAAVRRAGLDGHVRFLGNRSDVAALLASADLFVLPSLWEGLPMALLEAMASRLPVVATAVSGTRDVIEHERSGILVEAGSASALADAVNRVVADSDLAASLAARARTRIDDCYSARTQARRHAELYRSRVATIEGD